MVLTRPRAPSELLAPAPFAAAALLVLNDHLLKPRFHDALTGKLSDVALGFLLPLLVSALLRPWWRHDRARLAGAAVLAALVLIVLELSATADAWVMGAVELAGRPFGLHPVPFTRDPTDLAALVMVPLAYAYGRRRLLRPAGWLAPRLLRAAGLGGMLLALAADESNLCEERAAPLTFKVEGDCGPAAVIVVDPTSSGLLVHNAEQAFGLTPAPRTPYASPPPDREVEGYYPGCPAHLTEGHWSFFGDACTYTPVPAPDDDLPPDAGRPDGAAALDAGLCAKQKRVCTVDKQDATLSVSCDWETPPARGATRPACHARLTVVDP